MENIIKMVTASSRCSNGTFAVSEETAKKILGGAMLLLDGSTLTTGVPSEDGTIKLITENGSKYATVEVMSDRLWETTVDHKDDQFYITAEWQL